MPRNKWLDDEVVMVASVRLLVSDDRRELFCVEGGECCCRKDDFGSYATNAIGGGYGKWQDMYGLSSLGAEGALVLRERTAESSAERATALRRFGRPRYGLSE
jgi:hypothetical protein